VVYASESKIKIHPILFFELVIKIKVRIYSEFANKPYQINIKNKSENIYPLITFNNLLRKY
jgi:hypothetical protein